MGVRSFTSLPYTANGVPTAGFRKILYADLTSFATPEEIGEFVAVMLSRYQGGGGFMSGSDVVYDGGTSLFPFCPSSQPSR